MQFSIMLSNAKYFSCVKHKLKDFRRFYSSDKPKNLQQTLAGPGKKSELLQKPTKITTERFNECSKFEEKVLKQVLREKEKDASIHSRLSKECRKLFNVPNKRGSIDSCLPLDKTSLECENNSSDWDSYMFNHLKLRDPADKPTGSKEPPKDSSKVLSTIISTTSGDGGITSPKPRIIRQEPGKVIAGFIPEEWWRFFIPKTGVTGFCTFFFTFGTYLVSKEIYVLEHNFYNGVSLFFVWIGFVKYIGPWMANYLDKMIEEYEHDWNKGRESSKQELEDHIVQELFLQFQTDGQLLLLTAKRENVTLQLEEEFRKRQMFVYDEVKRKLDYQVAVVMAKQKIQQKNLVEYVTREVEKSITPDMQDRLIYYSIDRIVKDLNKDKKE